MPKFFTGLFLNASIISLFICVCVQNLQGFLVLLRLGPFGTNLYLLI